MTETIARNNKRPELRRWFASRQGVILRECEREAVAAVLPDLFGYHIVQLGVPGGDHYLRSSRIGHRIVYLLEGEENDAVAQADAAPPAGKAYAYSAAPSAAARLRGGEEALPFAANSLDVVVAPHVLEYAARPNKLLREIERTLIDDGHLLILGFNPWSLWGLWRRLLGWRGRAPWHGCFHSARRLKDWLYLLDFEILHHEKFVFSPPLQGERLRQRLAFMEALGRRCWPVFGAVYLILARKRIAPLTPVKLPWRRKQQRLAAGVAEQAAPRSTQRVKNRAWRPPERGQ